MAFSERIIWHNKLFMSYSVFSKRNSQGFFWYFYIYFVWFYSETENYIYKVLVCEGFLI